MDEFTEAGRSGEADANSPFDAAWDIVLAKSPWIVDHVSGRKIKDGISLADCVSAFFTAAVLAEIPLTPDVLSQRIAQFPQGAFAQRAGKALAADIGTLWAKHAELAAEVIRQEKRKLALAKELSASTWLARPLPPVDRLLGDFVTTTSRGFLVGETGIGKTMLGLAIAAGMGFGIGFLHWRTSRPARVLYFDGEMPLELLVQRLRDAARRVGREDLIDNVMLFSTDDAESIAERWPMLGMFQPLNTEEGHNFIKRLCEALKPDAIIFDNVQALLAGVQKDEETWTAVLPLVQWLTKQRIGQLWIDHTNKGGVHYGTGTKQWRFDAVAFMTLLDEAEHVPNETAFMLSFTKARRRTPDNWNEFAPHIIRLREDIWTSEPAEKRSNGGGKLGHVAPSRKLFHSALLDAIAHAGVRPGETTDAAWRGECMRRDLIKRPTPDDTPAARRVAERDFRKAKSDLQAAHWVGVDGERVMDLSRSYR
jgi:hypothetical protein